MKILIAGAGIGGVSTALCLARKGHEVEVFEQAPVLSEVGAGIQLSPNCTRVLHYLDLEDELRGYAFLPEGTQFRSWQSGKLISETALGEAMLARYGFPYYHIHRADLMAVLVAAAEKTPGIQLHTNAMVAGFSEDEAGVQLQVNGASQVGDVLIGADGIHSAVRAGLWGNESPVFTGNVAWRALVPADKMPGDLIRPVSSVWWGPGKHFVHYYVRRGEFINCVCVVEKSGWEVESWTERGDYAELKSDFSDWHPDIQQLIDNVDRSSLFKWALYDRPPMRAWSKGRATLLGDACHPTLPFMAQGAAMAIEDGAVLAECLEPGLDVPARLKHYEGLRKARTARIQNGSRRNASVFHMSGVKAWARNRAAKIAGDRTMARLYQYNAFAARDA